VSSSAPLILGTRGSALALAQVELVKNALKAAHPDLSVEVKTITTSGDRAQNAIAGQVMTGAGLKGMFTKEIQDALLGGSIDVAVHSLKDLPGQTPQSLEVMAVLERADTGDVLISKAAVPFDKLPAGSRIGTNSVRRRKQLLWMRPDLVVEELRGNVPTRLRKLRENDQLAAIVLARAGLYRLGFEVNGNGLLFENRCFHTDVLQTLPAIGQGAIALEARADHLRAREILTAVNHEPTFLCIRAERELLRLLDGDCNLPVGARATLAGSRIRMSAIVFGADGEPPRTGEIEADASDADAPETLAKQLFKQLYDR
jgi:hydroxymethylbilane synthase